MRRRGGGVDREERRGVKGRREGRLLRRRGGKGGPCRERCRGERLGYGIRGLYED